MVQPTKKRVKPGHSRHLPEGRREKKPGRLIGDLKETKFSQIRVGREIRKDKKRARKLRKERRRRRNSMNGTSKRPSAHLETVAARIKKGTGRKKKPPTKAVRPVINVLIDKTNLTKQWAAVAKALVREGIMKVDKTTDLRKKLYETLLEIEPRVAGFFKAGLNIYSPRGKIPIRDRLRMASTKERLLVRDEKGRTLRAVKKPGGGKKKKESYQDYSFY
jgi:hypothetical protein